MKKTLQILGKITFIAVLSVLVSLFIVSPVMAVPVLPSSFYGTVKLNNANVPDGTLVKALIGGKVYAQAFTQTYQRNSVYSLDVPGDSTDTAALDGGKDGDTIQFLIGGIQAAQNGTWHSGTNVELNLTAVSTNTLQPPQPTPTHPATQTPISTYPSTPTQVPPTPTIAEATALPTFTEGAAQPTGTIAGLTGVPSATTAVKASAKLNNAQIVDILLIVAAILVAVLIIAIVFLIQRGRKK